MLFVIFRYNSTIVICVSRPWRRSFLADLKFVGRGSTIQKRPKKILHGWVVHNVFLGDDYFHFVSSGVTDEYVKYWQMSTWCDDRRVREVNAAVKYILTINNKTFYVHQWRRKAIYFVLVAQKVILLSSLHVLICQYFTFSCHPRWYKMKIIVAQKTVYSTQPRRIFLASSELLSLDYASANKL